MCARVLCLFIILYLSAIMTHLIANVYQHDSKFCVAVYISTFVSNIANKIIQNAVKSGSKLIRLKCAVVKGNCDTCCFLVRFSVIDTFLD